MKDGHGLLVYQNGDMYYGEFKRDQRSGRGLYLYASNHTLYDGLWSMNTKEGKGVLYMNDKQYNELYYFMNGEVVKKEYLHFYGTINKDYICKLDQIVQSKEYKELNDFV